MKKKLILTVCFPCGRKYNTKDKKGAIGVWWDTCDICGKKNVPCASAPHDFGIYSNDIRKEDMIQDLL